ncbi:MAG TPA: GTP cyclohydrolase I FolE [Candidatus Saccharimonadales bacterium]
MSKKLEQSIELLIKELIAQTGEDPDRPGLKKTPKRVVGAYEKILSGYNRSLKDEITTFDNSYKYDEIVYSGGIDFFSLCEHHLLPFFGSAHIGYIPSDRIIGLSKLARAVDIYSRRLQQQERLTMEIANELDVLLNPVGIIVMMEGKHFCNMARGVEQTNSRMKTIVALGELKENEKLRNSFFQLSQSFSK